MDGADAGTRQHGVDRLGNHGHVERHTVALADTHGSQSVGQTADLVMKLAVADVFFLAGFVLLPDERRLLGAIGQVTVDAVGADVE